MFEEATVSLPNVTCQSKRVPKLTVAGVLGDGEGLLDLSLEGEVKGLCGEVPQAVSEVTPPERVHSLGPEEGSVRKCLRRFGNLGVTILAETMQSQNL